MRPRNAANPVCVEAALDSITTSSVSTRPLSITTQKPSLAPRTTGCSETLQLVASVRGAVGSLMEELIEQHMREHVARPGMTDAARAAAAEEMLALIRRYGK